MDHRGQALELGLVSWGCWGTVWGLQRAWQDCASFADPGQTLPQGLPQLLMATLCAYIHL